MATLGKNKTPRASKLDEAKMNRKVGRPRNGRRKEWEKMGFRSYTEWFQMRNRIWKTVWKERENA